MCVCVCLCVGKRKKNAKTHWETNKSVKQKKKNAKKDEEEEKKNYKTKDERENHKNDMKFMRIFHFLLALAMQPLSSSHRGIGAQRGMGRGVAERGNERGGVRKNILGNVLCRVLSFLRDFPPLFYYFFRYPLDAICSAHRYIYIYTICTYIYIDMYMQARGCG